MARTHVQRPAATPAAPTRTVTRARPNRARPARSPVRPVPRPDYRPAVPLTSSPRTPGIGSSTRPQPSLEISSPRDPAELEATSTARRVSEMPRPADVVVGHRSAMGTARFPLQPVGTGKSEVGPDLSAELQGNLSGGRPLPPAVRGFMEPRFRADFSGVRIHTDAPAGNLSKQLRARAFTLGGHIFFAPGQYQPESPPGRELIAHELTHTIQQGAVAQQRAALQRSEDTTVTARTPVQVQRWGVSDALDYFADKANIIPGFRMFTIVLGVNPINMSSVSRSAANILRALIEVLPMGGLITQALDSSGVFDKAGAFVEEQIASLGLVGSSIKQAVTDFLDSLSWDDIFDLGGVWERAKSIFTTPIDQIIEFATGLVDGIVELVKDAILRPIAELAEGTEGYALLKAVLGYDPITGDAYPQTAETLIGPFMKIIGQEEIWENMQKANAIPRAFAWFQGALSGLLGFVGRIPDLFISAFQSLELIDVILIPKAFAKLADVFGGFFGEFVSWAGTTIFNLLEIIFDVVSPGAFSYVKKTGAALKSILQNPLPFVGNLVKAAKGGFQAFAGRFLTHLKKGLIDWLTGSLTGVYIPQALTLIEFGKFALSVLGISWANIRTKLVKAFGPAGETIVKGLETGFDIVKALVTGGPAAAWEVIKEKLSDLKDSIVSGITSMVVEAVVTKAIPKLVAMFIPGAGFISAIISIYDTIMVFVQKLSKIMAVVKGFIDSIVAIASGAIGAAISKVENVLSRLLSLAIAFLAGFAGLGKVADKVMGIVKKVQAKVDQAIDAAIAWIVGKAKAIVAKLLGKKDKDKDQKKDQGKPAIDVGESVPFAAGAASHRLYIQVSGTAATVMVASAAQPLDAALTGMERKLSTLAPESRKKATPLIATARSLLTKTDKGADQVAASLAASGPAGNALPLNEQVKADEHVLARTLGELFTLFGGAAGLPFSLPVSMAGGGHTLTIKDEGGHLTVWMASREDSIRGKFAQVDRILQRWEDYINGLANPAIKEEFSILLLPEIKAKKASGLAAAVAKLEGMKSADFETLKAQVDAAIKGLAADISAWAVSAGLVVQDFSDEAVKAELDRQAEAAAERVWQSRKDEAQQKLEQFVTQIQALDSAARLKYRGSLAKGRKGVSKGFGAFDPFSFDIDLFIESDKLYLEAVGGSMPARASSAEIWADRHPGVRPIIQSMSVAYNSITGVRRGDFSLKLRAVSNVRELLSKAGTREYAGETHVEITPPKAPAPPPPPPPATP